MPAEPTVDDIGKAPESLPAVHNQFSPPIERLQEDFTRLSLENADLRVENDRLKQNLASRQVRDGLIKPYANKIFYFLCVYTAASFGIVISDAIALSGFKLSDTVLGLIIGSNVVSLIGLVSLVVKGLFSPLDKPPEA